MITCKEDAVQFLRKKNGNTKSNNNSDLQASLELLQKTAADEGLEEDEIQDVVNFLTGTKLNGETRINILKCLIPKTKISNQSLEDVLLWFFTELGNESLPNELGKKFLQWLAGITYYELADVSVIESYYSAFIFLLRKRQLESAISKLLCLISKPEDARRWVVQQILEITAIGRKPQTNSLLGVLKSYQASVVPERIPQTNFHYQTTSFDDLLKKAHARVLKNDTQDADSGESNIEWKTLSLHDARSKWLNRLIPSVSSLNNSSDDKKKKLRSIYEFKTMASIGVRPFLIECPAETLSLLANKAGCHFLAFSDITIKTRFFHKLYHTLFRVYLLELEPYSEEEKIFFLNSLAELQEYTQQGIPVVTRFLLYYLPDWDGDEYREQILRLLEWLDINDEEDLRKHVFRPLRQIFISCGTHCRCLIIETLAKFLRNLLITNKKERTCFGSNFQHCNEVKCIETVAAFASELISVGLIWNNENNSRNILNAAVEFYRTSLAVEQAFDLPIIMVMPPAMVYSCLFSNSRVCIEKMSSLLVELHTTSLERLNLLGVFEDFASEVQKLEIYILDYYRCLWSQTNHLEELESFIFQHNVFNNKKWKLKEMYGDIIERIFTIEYNSSFWNPMVQGSQESMLELANSYPATVQLRQKTEEILLRAGLLQPESRR